MIAYFMSVFGTALTVAIVNLLAPGTASKIIRLISSLILVCVLIAPLPATVKKLIDLPSQLEDTLDQENGNSAYEAQMQEALNTASRTYFAQALTQMLEQRFEIPRGELRCIIQWEEDEETARPQRITVVLSGSAKWKNPDEIESFVSGLLGCSCVSAIE